MLARQLEQRWSKDRILTAYLNTIYFGNGAYGIEQAAHDVLRPRRAEADARRGGAARRHPRRPEPRTTRSRTRAQRQRSGAQVVLTRHARPGLDRRDDSTARPTRRRCRGRRTCGLPQASPGQAQYFTNYVKQQLIDEYGAEQVFGGGLRVQTTIDLDLQKLAREAISKWLPNAERARRRRSSRSTRATAACSRWSAAGTTTRASSTSPSRASASRARRSSRSCSRPRSTGDLAGDDVRVEAGHIPSTTSSGTSTTTRATTSGRSTSRRRRSYSDNSVYAQLTRLVGPNERRARRRTSSAITSPLNDYFSIGLGGEAVNPLEMARAYSTFANGGERDRRLACSATGRARSLVDRRARPGTTQPVAAARSLAPNAGTRSSRRDPRASSDRAAPASARSSPTAGESPARPARPRTTATPGSSATRRSSSSRSGSATRTR